MSYALGIMEASTTQSRWLRTRLFTALIGACGFGLELGRSIGYYKHPEPGNSLVPNAMLAFIFLAIAVQNSILLISQMRGQDIAKK
jgi:hypothetical protein